MKLKKIINYIFFVLLFLFFSAILLYGISAYFNLNWSSFTIKPDWLPWDLTLTFVTSILILIAHLCELTNSKLFSKICIIFFISISTITIVSCSPEDSSEQIRPTNTEITGETNTLENFLGDTTSFINKLQKITLIPCGGDFNSFIKKFKEKSYQMGYEPFVVENFFKNAKQDPEVIRRDRSQGIFKKTFIEFSKLVMTDYRISKGKQFFTKHEQIFSAVYQKYGVSPAVLLSFLALETDFGVVQGDFNTLNSLITLSHDCRRPDLFQPHIFAALHLFQFDNFDPDLTRGAWAGEIGMIQMLPKDIVLYGVDQDGDEKINLQSSVPDVLMTAGNILNKLGWKPYQPWLVEIIVPQNLNWAETGLNNLKTLTEWKILGVQIRNGRWPNEALKAAVLLPHGRYGPAFFALPNYQIYLQWNKSFIYSTTSAFFATLFADEPMYYEGRPSPPLSDDELKRLQTALTKRGYDVGAIDGIIGAKTRSAIQKEQIRLGLPADAWPTKELLTLLE